MSLKDFAVVGKTVVAVAVNYKFTAGLGKGTSNLAALTANKMQNPKYPMLFLKSHNTYIRQGEKIKLPKDLVGVKNETELGVVIGKKCKDVSANEAMNVVGGYCLALDLTAFTTLMEYRKIGSPWTIPKCFDTALPVSDFIPKDKIKNPLDVDISCKVNGKECIKSNTSDLFFNISDLIVYATRYMTLEPNDVILTGTPPLPVNLKSGDVIEASLGNIVTMKYSVE